MMLKRRQTKWIPLGTFSFQEYEYIVFVRGRKNGLLDFKTKAVNKWRNGLVSPIGIRPLINIATQWDVLQTELNKL